MQFHAIYKKSISYSFICNLIFVFFSSHVVILNLIDRVSSNQFDKLEHVLFLIFFGKFDLTYLIKQKIAAFALIDISMVYILIYILIDKFNI